MATNSTTKKSTIDALDRFASMFKPGTKLDVETHGSPNRSRYSVALAAVVMGLAMHAGAQDLPSAQASQPVAPVVAASSFSVADSIITSESRSKLGFYGVDAKNEMQLAGTAAIYKEIDNKLGCGVVLVESQGGYLPYQVLMDLSKAKSSNQTDNNIEVAPSSLSQADKNLLDRFVFYHEDSHCDSVTWMTADQNTYVNKTIPEVERRQDDKELLKESAVNVSTAMKAMVNKGESAQFFTASASALRYFSPDVFSNTLALERISDSRAALHMGQFMLIQKGYSIDDYERVMDFMMKFRSMENNYASTSMMMNDHDTYGVLKEAVKLTRAAYDSGPEGMKAFYGEAASSSASPEQLKGWNDKTASIARALTNFSFQAQGTDILNVFSDRINEQMVESTKFNELMKTTQTETSSQMAITEETDSQETDTEEEEVDVVSTNYERMQ